MRFVVRLLCLSLAGVLAGIGTGTASAQSTLPWAGCAPAGFQCATLSVPIDRSGAVPGSIPLAATRKPATSGAPARTAIVGLAGGPGQAALEFADTFAELFKAGLADRDLLVFDQRGTGKSAPLRCISLRATRGTLASVMASCAREIGARRGFYRTADSVADIEALRVAGGYDRLLLFGVSYGTKVAMAYASAYPQRTEALILDSVVPLDAPDAMQRTTLAAIPRALGQSLCGGSACARATSDVNRDVRTLASRVDRRSARGTVFTGSGARRTARVDAAGLLRIIQAGDVNPQARAELPGAVRAALRGDASPLLRLSARSVGLDNTQTLQRPDRLQNPGESVQDDALFFATMCEETPSLPWDRAADLRPRISQAEAFLRAEPASSWGLFPRSVAFSSLPSLCVGWPNASPPPAASGPLPNVRALLLAGEYDVRTPLEDAQRTAAQLPQSQLVSVPFTGHSVLTSEFGSCATGAVNAFLAGGPVAACTDTQQPFGVTPRPPRRLGEVSRVGGLPGSVGRTARGIALTVADFRTQVAGVAFATGALPRSLGGLRGGSLRLRGTKRATLSNYEFIPGLRLSGTYVSGGTSTYTVRGTAANGRVSVSSSGRMTGRLGGRSVRIAAPARAAQATPDELSFAELASRVRLR